MRVKVSQNSVLRLFLGIIFSQKRSKSLHRDIKVSVEMSPCTALCYKLDKSANPLPLVLCIEQPFCFPDRYSLVRARETREGRPLPTVETEVNGDSKSTNERDPSLVSSLDLSDLYERFCSALAALVGPVGKLCFPVRTPFNPTHKMGMQTYWVARLLVCFLW
jgi:hypothetical protein